MSGNNTTRPFIIQTMVMRLSEKESLEYLHDISRDTFYRLKRKVQIQGNAWQLACRHIKRIFGNSRKI